MGTKRMALVVLWLGAWSYGCDPEAKHAGSEQVRVGAWGWNEITQDWPKASRAAAEQMVAKYGAPDERTETQLVWGERGPWKRSVVSRDPVAHAWPDGHDDVLLQTVDYRVPPDRADDLARFDGSVVVERTKGELSVRCGGEAESFLAMNLAVDVVDGTRTVEEARGAYEEAVDARKDGETPDIMQHLTFDPPKGGTADLDEPRLAI